MENKELIESEKARRQALNEAFTPVPGGIRRPTKRILTKRSELAASRRRTVGRFTPKAGY